jgi:hypothetical protein
MEAVAYKDKADQYASQKRWYESHRTDQLERVRKNNIRYRRERSEIIKQAKSQPCKDCGLKYPHYVMDFDHVRGKKVENVSHMLGWSMEDLLKEIEKCEVVCANCHRERTHRRKHCGENEHSSGPHKPVSEGATPSAATEREKSPG